MANSKRKCKQCGEYVSDWIKVPAGTFCSMDHALEFASQPKNRDKAENKRHAAKKQKLRDEDRGYWLKKAQAAFNAYIRARDKGKPCISCGRMPNFGSYTGGSGIQAGHYRSVAAAPELRFNELNVHVQCVHCNVHKSSNAIDYRIALVKKLGSDTVEWLEGPHEPKKYLIEDLKRIEKEYKEKTKDLAQYVIHNHD